MYVIGLTGGIGTGKSVVAGILSEQGALILDADRLGHEVYLPDRPAYDDIVEEFGREVIAEDGTIAYACGDATHPGLGHGLGLNR